MTGDAAGLIGERGEPLFSDWPHAVLADPVGPVRLAIGRALGLLPILLQDLPDRLAVGSLALDLREVGLPETLAHIDSVSTCGAALTIGAAGCRFIARGRR